MRTERISFRWVRRIFLFCIIIIVNSGTVTAEPVRDGLVWLVSQQDLCGSWGEPTTTAYRDTCVALDALDRLGIRDINCGGTWPRGISWLTDANNPAPNWDYLAREMTLRAAADYNDPNIGQQRDELIAGWLGKNFYCWGAADGYNGDVMDTVQILKGLDASWADGLLECGDVNSSEWEDTYFLYIPQNATALVLDMTAYSGEVDILFRFGDGGYYMARDWDLSWILRFDSGSSPPLELETDCMFEVVIRNSQVNPSQYCLRMKYVTADFNMPADANFIDKTLIALLYASYGAPVAINSDDGWGLVYQYPSSVLFTAHAVQALQEYEPYIYLCPEIYADPCFYFGFSLLGSFFHNGYFDDYLLNHRDPNDGGFGDGGQSTVYDTVLSYQALKLAGPWSSVMTAARDYIKQAQDPNDGSWNQSIYETALALQVLGPLESVCNVMGDLDCDCCVDIMDLGRFAMRWLDTGCGLSNGWCGGAMLGNDEIVNFDDFARFAENWLECEYEYIEVPVQVYKNYDADRFDSYYTPGTDLIADDIDLGGTERILDHYDFTVYAPDGTAPYTVTSELYTNSAGYPGTAIAGTYCMHTVSSDGLVVLDCALGSGAILADNVWMVLSFSNSNAGWWFGEAAELGYTDDLFGLYEASEWSLYPYPWGGSPYAGFEANIWCAGTMAGQ